MINAHHGRLVEGRVCSFFEKREKSLTTFFKIKKAKTKCLKLLRRHKVEPEA